MGKLRITGIRSQIKIARATDLQLSEERIGPSVLQLNRDTIFVVVGGGNLLQGITHPRRAIDKQGIARGCGSGAAIRSGRSGARGIDAQEERNQYG